MFPLPEGCCFPGVTPVPGHPKVPQLPARLPHPLFPTPRFASALFGRLDKIYSAALEPVLVVFPFPSSPMRISHAAEW